VLVALLGLLALAAGGIGSLFSCSPANVADAGVLAREAPPFAIAGLLWVWLALRLWSIPAADTSARYLSHAFVATVVAWLLSPAFSICWSLALLATLLALVALRIERRSAVARRLPTAIVFLLALGATFTLPIWGRHGGFPRTESERSHAHPIWQLGHLH
jgi:hypothetical protein